MFLLPLFLLLFPPDSLHRPYPGLSLGTGLPFGGNGIQAEIRRNASPSRSFSFLGGLGLSIGGAELPETDYYWLNNSIGVQWEKGLRHRFLFSAGLVSGTLAARRPRHDFPEKRFVIGPSGSAGYCLRTKNGFHFQAGMSLVLIQNPMENSPAFHLSPAPFAGLGWSWEYSKK
jgi:hypothetical protein